MSCIVLEVERELPFGGGTLLLGLADEQGTEALRMEFVDADGAIAEAEPREDTQTNVVFQQPSECLSSICVMLL